MATQYKNITDVAGKIIGSYASDPIPNNVVVMSTTVTNLLAKDPLTATLPDIFSALQQILKKLNAQ